MPMYFFEVKSWTQLESYMSWLESQNKFPVEFYLNGVCYEIKDERSLMFFSIGQEAIFNAIGDISEGI